MISLCLYFLCRSVSKKFIAGGGAYNTSVIGGAFTFDTNNNANLEYWALDSANILSINILYVWRY